MNSTQQDHGCARTETTQIEFSKKFEEITNRTDKLLTQINELRDRTNSIVTKLVGVSIEPADDNEGKIPHGASFCDSMLFAIDRIEERIRAINRDLDGLNSP